jgi:hypothetical protein
MCVSPCRRPPWLTGDAPLIDETRRSGRRATAMRTAGARAIHSRANDATAIILFMPIAIFDSATIPRDRRAELEAAVVAAGKHLSKRFEGWMPHGSRHTQRLDISVAARAGCPQSAFVARNDAPPIAERPATRGRVATEGGGEWPDVKMCCQFEIQPRAVPPAYIPNRNARGEPRGQGRVRSSMTHPRHGRA